jgi:23S rRNA pseudouridine2605 synthase
MVVNNTPPPRKSRLKPGEEAAPRGSGNRVTLARAISKLGFTSRSQARLLVSEGRVTVNGTRVSSPDAWIDPRRDRIAVDGKPIRRAGRLVLVLHKPEGVVTTRSDERGRRTVYSLLPPGTPWVFPVGRLDRESSGIILLTNDTRLGEAVTNPLGHVPKTYEVRLDRPLDDEALRALRSGLSLRDGTLLRPADIILKDRDCAESEIVLWEGRNRQIRRMCEEMGYNVRRLHRTAVGSIRLSSLPPGKVRLLKDHEVQDLISQRRQEHHGGGRQQHR